MCILCNFGPLKHYYTPLFTQLWTFLRRIFCIGLLSTIFFKTYFETCSQQIPTDLKKLIRHLLVWVWDCACLSKPVTILRWANFQFCVYPLKSARPSAVFVLFFPGQPCHYNHQKIIDKSNFSIFAHHKVTGFLTWTWSCFGYICNISLTHLALEDLTAVTSGTSLSIVPAMLTSAPKQKFLITFQRLNLAQFGWRLNQKNIIKCYWAVYRYFSS